MAVIKKFLIGFPQSLMDATGKCRSIVVAPNKFDSEEQAQVVIVDLLEKHPENEYCIVPVYVSGKK